jgi:hypothetical protein
MNCASVWARLGARLEASIGDRPVTAGMSPQAAISLRTPSMLTVR